MNPNDDKQNDKRADRRAKSSGARFYAVQALYQMEAAGQSAERVMREFETHRLGAEDEDGRYLPADEGLFTRVVDGHRGKCLLWLIIPYRESEVRNNNNIVVIIIY